ncbi:hypothetical protein [Corynebacterium caspium]|uniref:hypothetical protein n=1 Tax=Corynebacterium caspium TaxID=234828 RepID=UPI00036F6758|nr:hypothetical protein [Corynebacterium caspium]WKD58531.1 hypothetical protein CCASP_00500 [Corynebacterium caspium DSM 44850]
MDITLATFTRIDPAFLPGLRFTNAWSPSASYPDARLSTLTGQYYQRQPRTRITDIFATAGYRITETTAVAGPHTFRLLEEPSPAELQNCPGVIATTSLLESPCNMAIYWPGVATGGHNTELVSPLDLAPTLAAIAGLDVRPNAPLSFDGMNLVPVIRYNAAGHGALFFPDGQVRGPQGFLSSPQRENEWAAWEGFMKLGPLQ